MAQYTIDHVGRMRQIKATLDQSSDADDAVQQKEAMLEELMDIVDNIDCARGVYMLSDSTIGCSIPAFVIVQPMVTHGYQFVGLPAFVLQNESFNLFVFAFHQTMPFLL